MEKQGDEKREQADSARVRETPPNKLGKEAEVRGHRDGEPGREATPPEVLSSICSSVQLGLEGPGDDGPDSG